MKYLLCALVLHQLGSVSAFSSPATLTAGRSVLISHRTTPTPSSLAIATTSSGDGSVEGLTAEEKKKQQRKLIRQEGGLFAFNTKYGALNPFAIYYGLVAIFLGIPWFFALTFCQLFYFVTRGKVDQQRRMPVFITHIWGTLLMRLTGCYPKMVNKEILKQFYKSNRNAMYVANHCSWDDIPFLGATIGWRNYKIVAKKELEKVPILGKAIRVAGNIEVDRTNRRSQLATLKKGIQYMKDGVNLCTFAEGTRSRTGRLMKFKEGAFKMAHKAGAPVIPIAIVGAQKSHPPHWIFPFKPTGKSTTVIVGRPVESEDNTEAEISQQVRDTLIANLPEDQQPL